MMPAQNVEAYPTRMRVEKFRVEVVPHIVRILPNHAPTPPTGAEWDHDHQRGVGAEELYHTYT